MMSESLNKINNTRFEIQQLSFYLQEMYKDSIWDSRLIYFDVNYKNFLSTIIYSDNNLFYWLKFENEIIGFIHVILKEEELYLNNIFIKKAFQGKNLAPKFLFRIIDEQKKKYFTLNVFQSNSIAVKWYKKLGMIFCGDTYYYNLRKYDIKYSDYDIKHDAAGFESIFINKDKIATIINKKIIMLHDLDFQISFKNYNAVLTKSDKVINSESLELFDVSHKMTISSSEILQNLIKKIK